MSESSAPAPASLGAPGAGSEPAVAPEPAVTTEPAVAPEPALPDRQIARHATGLLGRFNAGGVLTAADVHTADRVSAIVGLPAPDPTLGHDAAEQVRLALALCVRAVRNGSVCVDLSTVAATSFDEAEERLDVSQLPWPEPTDWFAACETSPAVQIGPEAAEAARPLRLVEAGEARLLYLERYWQQEESVRQELTTRRTAPPLPVDTAVLRAGLDRLFGPRPAGEPDLQRLAAAACVLSRVSVLAGGPGTGKTTTVAKVLALVAEQQPGVRIALAAPTGKAAARLAEAVQGAVAELPTADGQRIAGQQARTLHRLLGTVPRRSGRFRHDADNRLPYDLVVVDEMSMVSLTMMARLLPAIRPDARIVLVGDPDQLSSVDAGAVMADVTNAELGEQAATTAALDAAGAPGADARASQGVVRLQRVYRYGPRIRDLAEAIRTGDDDAVIAQLRAGQDAAGDDAAAGPGGAGPSAAGAARIGFVELDPATAAPAELAAAVAELRDDVVAAGRRLFDAARDGEVGAALAALDEHRLLCGHRQGPYGEEHWSREVERWLAEALPGYGVSAQAGSDWYVGRPVLKTVNDYDVELYNGDTGVCVATPDGLRVAFARGGAPLLLAPVRLHQLQTVHAMTVHKSQGSQFQRVTFVAPGEGSALLTRELLYTAVTRARQVVRIIGTEAAVRAAVRRPASRASGLRSRLGR